MINSKKIDKADLLNTNVDILGNAYEYLIGQFASETGKKAGEYYTPQAVSKILNEDCDYRTRRQKKDYLYMILVWDLAHYF